MINLPLLILVIIRAVIGLAICGLLIYLLVLAIKALKRYINAKDAREEKAEAAKSLGEVLKKYRTERNMTQEFVAESLGVSRQTVSKWESGRSDPSTSNLIALAKLFGVAPEELLRQTDGSRS